MTHDNASVTRFQHFFARTAPQCRALVAAAVLSLCHALCPEASAQTTTPNLQYTKNTPDLGLRGAVKVDPSTLGMSIQVPLGDYPGRGGTGKQFGLHYNSKVWRVEFDDFVNGNMSSCWNPPEIEVGIECYTTTRAIYGENSVAGWTFGGAFPTIEWSDERYDSDGRACCNNPNQGFYLPRITVRFPDGSTHQLRRGDTPLPGADSFNGTYYSVDSSRMKYVGWPSAGTLYLPDGSRYEFANYAVTRYVDRNGNVLTAQLDTLGRQSLAPTFHNSYVHTETYSLPGVGVAQMNYTFDLRELDDTGVREPDMVTGQVPAPHRIGDQDKFGNSVYSPSLFISGSGTRVIDPSFFNPVVLHRIVLPDGSAYTFTYNEYGEIAKVVYPTGGYERYRYGQIQSLAVLYDPYAQANRGVVERRVSASGSAADEVRWLYGSSGTTVTTFAPDGSTPEGGTRTVRTLHTGYPVASVRFGLDDPRAGMAYDERVYAPQSQGGAMLRRTLTEWDFSGPEPGGHATAKRNPKVLRTVDILLDTGTGHPLAKTTTYQYEQASQPLNVTAVVEHGYVEVTSRATAEGGQIGEIPVGVPLRSTETVYVDDPAYNARNLVGLPRITTIRAGGAGNSPTPGAVVARSEIYYDEGNYFGTDMSPQPCGATKGREASTPAARGNVTTSSRWLDTLGAVDNPSAYLDTHIRYDQCGNTRQVWDAAVRGIISLRVSEMEYSSAYEFAYPTHTISVVPDPSDARATNSPLESWTAYDLPTGKVTSTTDANGKTTYPRYTDDNSVAEPLGRLLRVEYPNGGVTKYTYSDTPGELYVQTISYMGANQTDPVESRQYFDGLGRPVRAFLYDGTATTPWSVTDTYYDALGRVSKRSNAYRVDIPNASVPASCVACTTSVYDALGRVATVTTPDGAVVTTSYSGNAVTVTDQAGKKRKTITDGLGRLRQVVEAPDTAACQTDGAGCATTYEYDVLGGLRKVEQGGQLRYFMYDSFGRLIRAKNPEQGNFTSDTDFPALTDATSGTSNNQWSTGYTYDEHGNLFKRKDARNTTTTHLYDQINRVIQTSYSDGTPSTQRTYDKAPTNGLGRPYSNLESGTAGTTNFITAYDEMGRPKVGRTEFYSNGALQKTYDYSRNYDLMGHVIWQAYPSGHTVNYDQFDAAGRLKNFTGNLGDGTQRTYTTNITYDESSRMSREQFGTQTALYHKRRYNVRGQMWDVRLSTVSDIENRNRGAIQTWYTAQNQANGGSGTDNNGNIRLAHTFIPDNDAVTSSSFIESRYDYDGLNRLKYVEEYLNGQGDVTRQQYDYDRWGNRQINAVGTLNHPEATQVINEKQFEMGEAAAHNRLLAPGDMARDESERWMRYDPAGNLVRDTYTEPFKGRDRRAYDAEGRMTETYNPANALLDRYTYDADGRRVRRQTPSENVWQVYGFDGELIAEYAAMAAPTSPQKEYGYRNGELLITAEGSAAALAAGPTNLVAAPTNTAGTPQVTLSWEEVAGESTYRIERSALKGSPFVHAGTSTTNTFLDPGVSSQHAYLYRVCAANSGGTSCTSQYGNEVLATAYIFADDPIITLADNPTGAPLTPIKAQHVTQLREAVNAVRALAGLNAATWAETVNSGMWVRAAHVQELRDSLQEALLELSVSVPAYTDTTLATGAGGTRIKRAHFAELRLSATRGNGAPPVGGGATASIQWLITDHLGTPRMIANLSGHLAGPTGIKRHDYLPFGEEIGVGVGGRTQGQGYGQVDGNRKKWAQIERDSETGLDYAQSRYYSNTQGRFTTPDEFNGGPVEIFTSAASANPTFYAELTNPQSLNKYQYTYNDPLNMVDPNGHCPNCPAPTDTMEAVIGVGKALDNMLTNIHNLMVENGASPGSRVELHYPTSRIQVVSMSITTSIVTIGGFLSGKGQAGVLTANARTTATIAANAAQKIPKATRPGAAGGLHTPSGDVSSAITIKGQKAPPQYMPKVQQALDSVSEANRSPSHGFCCEPQLLDGALRRGVDPTGGTISVVRVRGANSSQHGTPLPICPSCRPLIDLFKLRVIE